MTPEVPPIAALSVEKSVANLEEAEEGRSESCQKKEVESVKPKYRYMPLFMLDMLHHFYVAILYLICCVDITKIIYIRVILIFELLCTIVLASFIC